MITSGRFVDDRDGVAYVLADMDPELRGLWHTYGNRRTFGLPTPLCGYCHRPGCLVDLGGGRFLFRHAPGHTVGACEYADTVARITRPVSAEHKEIAADLVIGSRRCAGWAAEVEQRLELPDGGHVVADVLARNTRPRVGHPATVVHEVQITPQPYDRTIVRTDERVDAGADRVFWWAASHDTLGQRAPGVVVDPERLAIVTAAYTELEPHPLTTTPTLETAASSLIRVPDPWIVMPDPVELDGRWALVRQHALTPAIEKRARARTRRQTSIDEDDEAGCERPPIPIGSRLPIGSRDPIEPALYPDPPVGAHPPPPPRLFSDRRLDIIRKGETWDTPRHPNVIRAVGPPNWYGEWERTRAAIEPIEPVPCRLCGQPSRYAAITGAPDCGRCISLLGHRVTARTPTTGRTDP